MEAGLYQLSFKVVMTGSNVRIVDNTKYVYGCTIDGNDSLDRNVGYLWKSVTPAVEEEVKLTFEVTAAEAAAGTPQYWLWNLSNIGDNSTFHLELSDITIEKTSSPSSPYIDFPNTEFLYLDTNSSTSTVTETLAKQSYVTTASYDELVVKAESLGGCEHFYIPIKGLTVGTAYTITFDELTTDITLGNNKAYDYGAWIDTGYSYTAKNKLWVSGVHVSQSELPHYCVSSVGAWNTNNKLSFTATATTMYWVWEYAAFTDNMWGNIHLKNVTISQGNTANVSSLDEATSFTLKSEDKELESNTNNNLNMISNTIANTSIDNETNSLTNIISNEIANEVKVNETISNSTNTVEDDEKETINNTVSNEIDNTNINSNTISNQVNENTINETSNNIVQNEVGKESDIDYESTILSESNY